MAADDPVFIVLFAFFAAPPLKYSFASYPPLMGKKRLPDDAV